MDWGLCEGRSYSDSCRPPRGLSSRTNTNHASTSTLYDSYARQTQTTSEHGAVTTYSYTTSPVLRKNSVRR